jgi:hypothetical protein
MIGSATRLDCLPIGHLGRQLAPDSRASLPRESGCPNVKAGSEVSNIEQLPAISRRNILVLTGSGLPEGTTGPVRPLRARAVML